jgi:hypothetical protein
MEKFINDPFRVMLDAIEGYVAAFSLQARRVHKQAVSFYGLPGQSPAASSRAQMHRPANAGAYVQSSVSPAVPLSFTVRASMA